MNVIERMATMYYRRGLWGKPELSNLVARGKLAEDAYRRITGEDYAPDDGEGQ